MEIPAGSGEEAVQLILLQAEALGEEWILIGLARVA
tara:strand:- start:656 stop:763 length:108 start_codon:yes stop_codon:yes gene_type:complete